MLNNKPLERACYIHYNILLDGLQAIQKGIIYMNMNQNQPKTAKKKKPYSLKRLSEVRYDDNLFDILVANVMTSEKNYDGKKTREVAFLDFVDWAGIDQNSEVYNTLVGIISETETFAFKAGFQTALELLK